MAYEPLIDNKVLRNFGFLTGIIFSLLFGIISPWFHNKLFPVWPWILAIILWVCALFAPLTLKFVYQIWIKIGLMLGWVNTRIILGIVFFLIVTPLGFLMRLMGRDLLSLKIDKTKKTYRIESKQISCKNMEVPF